MHFTSLLNIFRNEKKIESESPILLQLQFPNSIKRLKILKNLEKFENVLNQRNSNHHFSGIIFQKIKIKIKSKLTNFNIMPESSIFQLL